MKIAVTLVIILMGLFLLRLMLTPARSRAGASGPARRRQKAGGRKTAAANAGGGAFRGVSLKRGPQACEQAVALGKRRFLPGQLGQLPLEGCRSANCSCQLVHHEDRRSGRGDKRAPSSLRTELYQASGKEERRKRVAGRRKSDLA